MRKLVRLFCCTWLWAASAFAQAPATATLQVTVLDETRGVLPGASVCGRTNTRIAGWLGRADQRTKVKGMFVDPRQVAEIVRRHPEVAKARLVVSRQGETDAMALQVEPSGDGEPDAVAIAATLRDVTKLGGDVLVRAAGSLPNDGKVIADERDYSA